MLEILSNECFHGTCTVIDQNGFNSFFKYSIGWLRLLHHCLNQCEELREDITKSIAPTADLLLTCTTLLMSTSAILYSSNIESVLLTLGLHSIDMGLSLIDHILRNTAFSSDEGMQLLC